MCACVSVSECVYECDSVDKCSCVGTRVDIREQLEQAGSLLPSYDLVHLTQVVFLEASCLESSHQPQNDVLLSSFLYLTLGRPYLREKAVWSLLLLLPDAPPENRKQGDALQMETGIENWLNIAFNLIGL